MTEIPMEGRNLGASLQASVKHSSDSQPHFYVTELQSYCMICHEEVFQRFPVLGKIVYSNLAYEGSHIFVEVFHELREWRSLKEIKSASIIMSELWLFSERRICAFVVSDQLSTINYVVFCLENSLYARLWFSLSLSCFTQGCVFAPSVCTTFLRREVWCSFKGPQYVGFKGIY